MKRNKKEKQELTDEEFLEKETRRHKKSAEAVETAAHAQHRIKELSGTARAYRRYMVLKRVMAAALGMLVTATVTMYVVAVLYKNTGSFTVSMDKFDMSEYGLSLSETRNMNHKTSNLNAHIDETITNIAESSLPEDLDMIDGEHNGENYIAYTFYLQNSGTQSVDYEYSVFISGITQQLDSAIRIRLYRNGEYVNYARTRSDGGGPEKGTTEFFSEQIVTQNLVPDFSPGGIDKYTIVIWIEGDDPDCVDFLIGGKLRVDMTMSIADT